MAAQGTQKFILDGLDCANCAAKIEAAVQRETGISDVAVNFSTRAIFIPPEFAPQVQRIIDRIEPGVKLIPEGAQAGAPSGVFPSSKTGGELDTRTHRHDDVHDEDHTHDHEGLGKRRLFEIGLAAVLFVAGLIFHEPLHESGYGIGEYLLLLPAYWLVGRGVIRAAWRNVRRGVFFDENSLMTIATVGAILIRELPEAVGVMLFYSVGEAFQDYAVDRSRRSIAALMDIRPDCANVRRGGETRRVHPEDVAVDEEIVVRPGEKIPLDGEVIEGSSLVDTSALTGESLPRPVGPGATVLAGMVNTSGLLGIRVTKPFGESSVAKILELVEHAGARKARTEKFITRFSRYYTPAVVLAAAGIAVLPPLVIEGAQFSQWFYRALVLLVISCPCALVLSIPVGYFGGIGGASRRGILIKGANFLDALAKLDTVVMDKTGTLTEGVFKVRSVSTFNGFTKEQVLHYAAHAESFSRHPIAASILAAYAGSARQAEVVDATGGAGDAVEAPAEGGPGERSEMSEAFEEAVLSEPPGASEATGWPDATATKGPGSTTSSKSSEPAVTVDPGMIDQRRIEGYEEIAGHGVIARIDGRTIVAGNDRMLHRESVPHDRCDAEGTVVNVAVDGRLAGQVIVADEIKEDAVIAIRELRRLGVARTVMLTGDDREVAERVAGVLGIDEVYSGLLPEEKVQVFERIAAQRVGAAQQAGVRGRFGRRTDEQNGAMGPRRGGTIAFVGDGINDAPVLTRADVGIAMGGLGQDAAIEAADVVIMDDRPSKVAKAIAIARRTHKIVLQNIVFALAVKVAVIVMGAMGLASMWGAVFADVGVSLLAVLNAMRALRA